MHLASHNPLCIQSNSCPTTPPTSIPGICSFAFSPGEPKEGDDVTVQITGNSPWVYVDLTVDGPGYSRKEFRGNTDPLVVPVTWTYILHDVQPGTHHLEFTRNHGEVVCQTNLYVEEVNRGEVNGDGIIDIVDALIVAEYSVGLDPLNLNVATADVNCDSTITILDALLIAHYSVGLITEFTCS